MVATNERGTTTGPYRFPEPLKKKVFEAVMKGAVGAQLLIFTIAKLGRHDS
jgi:hypothetical protein